MSIAEFFIYLFAFGIFLYSVTLVSFYILIGFNSIGATRKYLHKNDFTDYRILAASPHAPTVSILAPAYNEGATIVDNVRSLLSLYYNRLELVVINDGSKDDSLQRLIDAYELEKVDFYVNSRIPTKEVRGVYKTKHPAYNKLVVVDKENGGKADALNVGINIASNDYIICIDADCILEQDAILKMVKPFMEEQDAKVIASGGVIRIANSCEVTDGRITKVQLPENYWACMQALEYIRAFLLGRMAWARLDGLLLISGAFGAFDKEIAIQCGGYNVHTVGEDMELVVRMRRYMCELGVPYKVTYIPDPLCWTEAPDSAKILMRQRNRWTRGTIETLRLHKTMFLNPRYDLLGVVSYPYWFFFEMMAPLVEFIGLVVFFIMVFMGMINWHMFIIFLVFIILFGYVNSIFAIYMEVTSYNQYNKRKEIRRLVLAALSEPFLFHPFVVWSAIRGYIDYFRKSKNWGEMTRKGFSKRPETKPAE
ncbi:cellulose synthase/poly-beta-1,6-N-acetylglucosamine synthase-like glycosyltransferase [Chitinophaga skermanii]|uniref:Cellulose synthase/poly-beta-1,6-N-acetylglucosamine synthase-like glycosyltransferase n=1 Tax=Chitinophaga skermanii TaxID=331697 RepID=A0A327Q1D4_9BACT|nr:glycosyltransferase [Chitinophaga skermanii]RAI97567.1 cellulose synthase/poly-beta-1,6-N-acetylglucosamine synthase-like glycosyltransferase [Chitinophaga skermanii]